MSLARFNIITEVDKHWGTSIGNSVQKPWVISKSLESPVIKSLTRNFKELTTSSCPSGKMNVILMGRKTWEQNGCQQRFSERMLVLISKTIIDDAKSSITIYDSFVTALYELSKNKKIHKIFVVGGNTIFAHAMKFIHLCDNIYISKFHAVYDCDTSFPDYDIIEKQYEMKKINDIGNSEFTKYIVTPNIKHQECLYLELLKSILINGSDIDYRDIKSKSLICQCLKFNITKEFPLFTVKKHDFQLILYEVLFFMNGETDSKKLEQFGIKKWKDDTSMDNLKALGYRKYEAGDMGVSVGYNYLHYNAKYFNCDYKINEDNKNSSGYNQFRYVVDSIRTETDLHKIMLYSNNPAKDDKIVEINHGQALQFFVNYKECDSFSKKKKHLSCLVYCNYVNAFTELPYITAYYSIMLTMISHVTDCIPYEVIIVMGNTYIPNKLNDSTLKLINSTPFPWSKLNLVNRSNILELDKFLPENFKLLNYLSHQKYKYDMYE